MRYRGLRGLAAGGVLVCSTWLALAHALYRDERSPAMNVTLGIDGGRAARLFEGASGLAIRLGAAQRDTLYQAIDRDPLDGTAIAIAALDRRARGDEAGATALADHALRVQPRTRLAWLALIDRQMRADRTVAAAASILRLLAVDPERSLAYLPMLAAVTHDTNTIAPIAAALSLNPPWRTPFLGILAQGKYDPAVRYALMNPGNEIKLPTMAGDDTAFISDLVNKGDFERAYLAWVSLLPDTALGAAGVPYDGSFAGLPGAAPFNWQLTDVDGDRASIGEGALQISYSGRKKTGLASQVLMLEPGSYRLATVMSKTSGDGAGSGGNTLTWHVACLPGWKVLGDFLVDPALIDLPQRSAAFTVPSGGCGAVSLSLIGTAAEFPVRLNARMASVAVQQVQ